MLLSKFQLSIGLLILSGSVLIILSFYILQPSKNVEAKEGFKNRPHVTTRSVKNHIKKIIRSNPNIVDEIGEVVSDPQISDEINKTLKSKPIQEKLRHAIDTPKITRHFKGLIHKDPSQKKLERVQKEVKNLKSNLYNDIKRIRKNIAKVDTNIQEKVNAGFKKMDIYNTQSVKKDLKKDTPYDKILRAHNKLSDKNSAILELKRNELLEIRSIRKQIEKTEETMKINAGEVQNLQARHEAILKKHEKAEKILKSNKSLFETLVKQNLSTYAKLSEEKSTVSKDKKQCNIYSREVKRLSIRIESTKSEKKNAEEQLANLREQLNGSNTSLKNILKQQIEHLENRKNELDKNFKDLTIEIQEQSKKESNLQAKIKTTEMEIKSLENSKLKLEKEIADAEVKNKSENAAVQVLKKDILEHKNRIGIRNRTYNLLENELVNLKKQQEKLALTETEEERQLNTLETDSEKNRRTIAELQIVVKTLNVRPKDHPIANWDFTTGSLKDRYNKYQSETIGNIPIETFTGKKSAYFTGQSHIKIIGSINTTEFKSITMMINVQSNPGPYPRLWEFTNSNLGGSWCADSIFGLLSPTNNVGFYSMKDCTGPTLMSDKGDLPKGSWQHLAFIYNEKMDEMTLFINGKQAAHWAEQNNKKFQNKTYTNLYIMHCVERFTKNIAVAWFRIFDYSLNMEQINKDMNNTWS